MSTKEGEKFYQGGIQFIPAKETRSRGDMVRIRPDSTKLNDKQLGNMLEAMTYRNPKKKQLTLVFDGKIEEPIELTPKRIEQDSGLLGSLAFVAFFANEIIIEDLENSSHDVSAKTKRPSSPHDHQTPGEEH